MNNKIKEILEVNGNKYNVDLPKEVKEAFTCIDYELSVCSCELPKILDYIISNLQEEKELYDKVLKLNSDWNQLETYLKNEIKRLQSVEQTPTIILITGKLTDILDEMSEIKNV